jgi:ArsR family transcriptional regulator, arsenate/arsenite/antimonite-responsive transcriptional repressor
MKTTPHLAVAALTALAQESRLAIFRLLVQAGPAGLVAGQIAVTLCVPAATLSFHLKTLAQAGLVHGHPEGRFVRYVADFAAMHGLIDYLSENCCGSSAAACAPQSIACNKEKIA